MNDKTPVNVNPYSEETRFIPHPDGRTINITMSPWHWRSLDWLWESEGISAGFILHMADTRGGAPKDPSTAFRQFIEASIQSQQRHRAEREQAAKG